MKVNYLDILKVALKKYIGLLIISILLLIIPSILMSSTWKSYKLNRAALLGKKIAQAEVIKKNKNNEIQYSFKIKEAQKIQGKETIEAKQWSNVELGDSVQVLYQADNPSKNSLRKGGGITSPTFIKVTSVFLFFFIGLGLVTIYSFFVNLVYFNYKVLNFGKKTKAKITALDDIRQIHYEYKDQQGELHKDHTKYLTKQVYQQYSKNEEIEIYYDEENSNKSIFIGENWKDYL